MAFFCWIIRVIIDMGQIVMNLSLQKDIVDKTQKVMWKLYQLYKFEFFEVSELATLVLVPAVLEKSGNHVYIIEKKFNSWVDYIQNSGFHLNNCFISFTQTLLHIMTDRYLEGMHIYHPKCFKSIINVLRVLLKGLHASNLNL